MGHTAALGNASGPAPWPGEMTRLLLIKQDGRERQLENGTEENRRRRSNSQSWLIRELPYGALSSEVAVAETEAHVSEQEAECSSME